MDLSLPVQIVQTEEEFTANDGNVGFAEHTRFELWMSARDLDHGGAPFSGFLLPDQDTTRLLGIPSRSIAYGRARSSLYTV